MTFLTPYTVLTEAFIAGVIDEFGNPEEAWQSPVEQPVIGWEVPVSTEPLLAGHDRVVVELVLYAPPSFVCGPDDRVTIKGHRFQVIGFPQDTDGNPFLWHPGQTVNLRRARG